MESEAIHECGPDQDGNRLAEPSTYIALYTYASGFQSELDATSRNAFCAFEVAMMNVLQHHRHCTRAWRWPITDAGRLEAQVSDLH